MKMKTLLLPAVLLSISPLAFAGTYTIDFEEYPEFTQITNQYATDFADPVAFTNALQLDSPDYNITDYPPHSGVGVITNDPNDPITLAFSALVSNVSGWYAAPGGVTVTAYDSGNVLLDTFVGTGVDGSNLQFSVASTTPIAWIAISSGGADSETVDDISFTTTPEPGSLFLFGSGALGLIGLMRRRLVR